MNCIRCNQEAQIAVRALQLRTLHVRTMAGEEVYQVPDDEVREYGVCRRCAQKWLSEARKGNSGEQKTAGFGAVAVIGILLFCAGPWISTVFSQEQLGQILRLPAAAAMFCGVVGILSTLRNRQAQKRRLTSMTEEEALLEAAWQVFLLSAPKEMGEQKWRLTYIPVTEKTFTTKPGDLTVLYDIQPSAAREVMHKIEHPQA